MNCPVLDQAVTSLLVGGSISALMFLPVLIWQYRRYGAFLPGRTLWTVVTFVYTTALITYTLFPLPDTSGDFCATHPQVYVLDPTLYFREMAQRLAGLPIAEILLSWDMLQMVFNVALFIPLGVILSDFLVIKARWGIPAGLGVSLLVEATQFTANWGLVDCPYRVADVNDLITNTTGTAVGYLIALLIPRFVARPAYLRKRRLHARPVTVWRRWTGMGLDVVYFGATWMLAMTVASVGALFLSGEPLVDQDGGASRAALIAWDAAHYLVVVAVVVLPALIGNQASLGQRTVYLQPAARSRWQLFWRMFVVQGALVIIGPMTLIGFGVLLVWTLIAVLSVLFTRRGLSCVLSGCRLVDSRADDEPAPNAEALADSVV